MKIENKTNQTPPIGYPPKTQGTAQSALQSNPKYSTSPINEQLCSPEASKAIRQRFDALLELDRQHPFIEKNALVAEVYKKTVDVSQLFDYISKDPVLSQISDDYEDFQEILHESLKEKYNLHFDLNSKKEALEKLSAFGAKPENKKIFEKIGNNILGDIVGFNSNDMNSFTENGINNLRKLFDTPTLDVVSEKLKIEVINEIIKDKDQNGLISKNIDVLERALKKPEYAFMNNVKLIDADLIRHKGDLGELLELLKKENSTLHQGEELKVLVDHVSGESQIRRITEHQNGLKLEKINFYDKKLNLNSTYHGTTGISSSGEKTLNSFVKDLNNNTNYSTRGVFDERTKSWILTSQIKEERDAAGKLLNREIIKLSNIDGAYNIKTMDAQGRIHTKSSACKNKNGTIITKNLVSPDGTVTKVRYNLSPNGEKEAFGIQIAEKDGTVIAQKTDYKTVLNNIATQEDINGKKYRIHYAEDGVKVFDETTQKISKIDLSKMSHAERKQSHAIFKKLPATELIAISENIDNISSVEDIKSSYMLLNKKLSSSPDPFIFAHELGHSKDSVLGEIEDLISKHEFTNNKIKHKISSDKVFQKIFAKEKQMFDEAFPKTIRTYTNYFTSNIKLDNPTRRFQEVIAETNGIINIPVFAKWIMKRTHFLQENFPRTIAYLMKHKL